MRISFLNRFCGGDHRNFGAMRNCVARLSSRVLVGLTYHQLVRTDNLHTATWAGEDRQSKSMQLDDRGHEIESEAHTGRISYLVGAIKTPLHGVALVFADAAAGVRH